MRVLAPLAAALALAPTVIGAAQARSDPPPLSWGKAGVSFMQYRTDAIECALSGSNRDVADTSGAQALVKASKQLERVLDNHNSASPGSNTTGTAAGIDPSSAQQNAILAARVVEAVRPEEQLAQVKQVLVSAVEECLVERGYSRFQLTTEQADYLGYLEAGSAERHAYLHSLATNPDVLEQQKV